MKTISHISDRAWSSYKESDYSVSQWHNACLVHNHTGPPTSKNQCKLPVKTPNGAVNSNGVQAAAAALAGARGGVKDISQDQRASAITALKGHYKDMGKELPPSLQHSSVEEFLSHHGIKGMHWGFRNASVRKQSPEHKLATRLKKKHLSELTNDELKKLNERLNFESNYKRLNPTKIKKGKLTAKEILEVTTLTTSLIALAHTKPGQLAIRNGKKVAEKALAKTSKAFIRVMENRPR